MKATNSDSPIPDSSNLYSTEPNDTLTFQAIAANIFKSKKIMVCVGAGISTSAGIADFRSSQGIYKLKNCVNLFEATTLTNPKTFGEHVKMIAGMKRQVKGREGTKSHEFMKILKGKGRLGRVYSQNIDGLEGKVGLDFVAMEGRNLSKFSRGGKGKGKELIEGDVVALHGSIDFVRCSLCGFVGELKEDLLRIFENGKTKDCPSCTEITQERALAGKRLIPIKSYLRPSIVLYGEPAPAGDTIATVIGQDLKVVDFVLVMGTSLKIPGFKLMVKEFAAKIRSRRLAGPRVILVGNEPNLAKEWEDVFDYQVIGDCDDFVNRVVVEWKKTKPNDWRVQTKIPFGVVKEKVPVPVKAIPAIPNKLKPRGILAEIINSPTQWIKENTAAFENKTGIFAPIMKEEKNLKRAAPDIISTPNKKSKILSTSSPLSSLPSTPVKKRSTTTPIKKRLTTTRAWSENFDGNSPASDSSDLSSNFSSPASSVRSVALTRSQR